MSQAGKEILLKTVVQAIPNYLIGNDGSGIKWMSWKRMGKHKEEDGMVREGSNPNFIWRSLCSSKYLLQKDSVKRIGNGFNTRIFNDPWLPVGQSLVIHSIPDENLWELRVADIIDWDTRTWNTNKLETLFSIDEIDCITRIPLGFALRDDQWLCKLDKKGRYTVKSGYSELHNATSPTPNRQFWRKI
ncbi:hypothetical protein KY290_005300 [Solanum tuberosum]|uniref:Uncharacterized protein n=1 Tax=Solanum tuberosum TaxID=4113 RepID=A0ABQ7WFJ2_SOLTU|nr:hypothetical protein KY289_005690 [Solanum tuberosum]KAH0778873.1 hypothetical protein KY290_005300 [Solanum tuberosum]